MTLFPEVIALTVDLKVQLSPFNIGMFVALAVCAWVVIRWAKRRI